MNGYEVNLISMTKPIGFDRAEDLISYCARVSNPSNQSNFKTSEKLLLYCIQKRHWSIFEMVDLTFGFSLTRDIGRQVLRHSFDFQEFSQRYSEVDSSNFVFREVRLQDNTNRQNSIESDDKELQDGWDIWQKKVQTVSANAYKWAIEKGIAKEQARVVLPEGMTPSVMYVKGSLRNFIHYVDVRQNIDTQKEHRFLALEVKKILKENFNFLKQYWVDAEIFPVG